MKKNKQDKQSSRNNNWKQNEQNKGSIQAKRNRSWAQNKQHKHKNYRIKNIRRIIQWSFSALFITAFIPPVSEKIKAASDFVINIQFFPSLIRSPLTAAVIVLLTALFGRIYCSSVCPLATFQDFFLRRRKNDRFRKLKIWQRYSIPAAAFLILLAGFPSLSSLIDPYSLTGKFILFLNRIVIIPMMKLTAAVLHQFSIYLPGSEITFSILPLITALPLLILLIMISVKRGRLFCNTLCPVGALLSFFSKFSLYRVRIREERCTSCGACERICKAEAADSASRTIDASKCISCFNCLSVCSFDAIEYSRNKNPFCRTSRSLKNIKTVKNELKDDNTEGRQSEKNGISLNERRNFLKITAAGFVLLASSLLVRQKSYSFKNKADSKAVPPGAVSQNNLLSKCTGCALCINNCPTGVLRSSVFTQLGIPGLGVPFLDYKKAYCDYKCKVCSEICPAGALIKLDLETKKTVKIGEAEFVRKYCIVETDRTSCGACAEVCPTGAIDLIHIGSSESGPLEIPVINMRYCIGCGACEFACPVIAKNAIFVNPFSVHEKADPPAEKDESQQNGNQGTEQDNTDTGFAF